MVDFKKNSSDLISSVIEGMEVDSAETLVDIARTDWDEEQRSTQEMHYEVYGSDGQCGFMKMVNEASVISVIWSRLPSRLKSKIDMKKLGNFVGFMDDGSTLSHAAMKSGIKLPLAVDLMSQIEKMGIL